MYVNFFNSLWHIIFFGPRRREIVWDRFKLLPSWTGPYDLSPSWQIDFKVKISSSFRSSATGEYEFFFNLISAGETELEDSITLRARNPGSLTLTRDQVRQMLQKADFEGHGFQKEESRRLYSAGKFPANSPVYMTTIFYYKKVNCSQSQVMQVFKEAEKLLPGNRSQYLDDNLRIHCICQSSVKAHSNTKIIFLAQ